MTMDNEVVDICKNCSVLRTELDKKTELWEKNKSQTLTGFLTLKQKIVGTDKLIQEYQSSKVECDILTRKNPEFVHLTDQLHRNLSTRNQEYSQIYGSIEQLKKANAEYEIKFKELQDEAQKWKLKAEAGENFTSQLVEKVKVLEKYEEEVKHTSSVSRECERMESKVKNIKGQLKEAKETTNKSKKEICKLQREYNLLVKYAKQWGKMIEKQGKFNTYQQKFYLKLCKGEEKDDDDVDQDVIDANETDEQSKLLEQLLDEGEGSCSIIAPTNIPSSEMEVSEANSLSHLTDSLQSPVKSLPCKQAKQSRTRTQRRGNQDNATPSMSPDKTPTSGLMTRNRTRTASQNSVNHELSTLSSDADTATESEKDSIVKRSGSLTRSRSVKITAIPELIGSEPISTFPCPSSLPELIAEIPRHHKRAIDNIVELDTRITKPIIMKPLVSSLEMEPINSPGDLTIPASTSSISVIPNIQSHSQLNTTVSTSNLSGFGSDSSSDSDMEMIPVPNCKFRTNSSEEDPSVLTDPNTSLKTSFSGIFGKTGLKNSPAEEFPQKSAQRIEKSCSIFALEADLDMSSSESEADVVESKQETTSIFSNSEMVVQASSFSLDEDHSSAVPDSVFNRDVSAALNVEKNQQTDGEVPLEKENPKSNLLIVNDKEETVNESRNDCGEIQEESSKPVENSVNISQKETGMLKSLEEREGAVVVENEKKDRETAVVNVSQIMQKVMQTNPFDMDRIDNSEVISEIQTQMPEFLDNRPDFVENPSENTFQRATDNLPERLEVDLLHATNLTPSADLPLEIERSKELEENVNALPVVAESEMEEEAVIVIPEQLPENLPTQPVDSSADVSFLFNTSPIESELPKLLEKNHDAEPIENQETLQNDAGVVFSDKQQGNLQTEDASSIDTEISKLFNSKKAETMVVDDENVKEFVNVSVLSPENSPMDSESGSESVDPLSTESLLVETSRQNQLEEIQELHQSVVVAENNDFIATDNLQKDSEIEVVATFLTGTRITEPFKEILEVEPIADDNPDETSPVPLEKNTELVASPDEDSPIEAEIPQSSKENEEFESSGNNSKESQSEQADNLLIHESGSKPEQMLNDQHEAEQMVVVEKTEEEFSRDETKASCQKPEERSIFDDVCELSVSKSPCKTAETKLTEENQRNDLVDEIIIEKPFSRNELVAAVAVDKLDIISSKDVDTFSSNTSPVMLGESNSMEDQVSEISVIDKTTQILLCGIKLSNDFPLETEKPTSSATNFNKKSKEDSRDEDVIISMENPLEGQDQDVEELSNTKVQVESGVLEPIEKIQEFQALLNDESDEETANKTQVDGGVELSTKNILVQSGSSSSTKVGDRDKEKLFDSNGDNPLQVLQDGSTPKVAESLLQVEDDTKLSMPTEDDQQALVNNQREKELPDEVEDFLDKPQKDQQPMSDNNVDPEETLKEESQLNITEPVGKNSKDDLEEFEVGKSANNKQLIEVEIEGNPETESIEEMITSNDNQEVNSNLANESSSKVDVAPETISFFKAVQELPTMEETVSQASQPVRPMISDHIFERSQPVQSEKSGNPPFIRDAQRSLFDPSTIIQEPVFIQRNSSMLSSSRLSPIPQSSDHPSAFKVPRVPNTPPRVAEVKNMNSNFPWSKGVPHGLKRSAVDDEVAVILKQIRTNIIELPATVSPLPKSPEPQPIAPKKMEEPKSKFPVLPRCAFNWTAKKLPISDTLTERFGSYLHFGVQVRVRFRKVGRRLRDVTFPDIFSNRFHSVTNFVEAERPKPILRSLSFLEDIADVVELENKIPQPDLVSRVSVTDPKILSEKRPHLPNNLFSNVAVVNIDVTETNPTSSITSKTNVTAPLISRPKAAKPDLFGSDSSSSESECESNVFPPPNKERPLKPSPIQKDSTKHSTHRNPNEKQPEPGTGSGSQQPGFNSSRAQALSQLVEPFIPLGRCDRSVIRRDLKSPTTDQTRRGLGLRRGVKTSQHITISPCSESLLKLAKTPVSRVIAPLKRPFQQPEVPTSPLVTSLVLPDCSSALNETPFRKRVSHTLKRGSEPEAIFDSLLPASKRVRTHPETSPQAQSHSFPVNPDNVESEILISARTRLKSKTFCSVKPGEMSKSNVKKVQPRNNKLRQKSTEKSPSKAVERCTNLVTENSTSESDSEIESMQLNSDETGQSSSTEKELINNDSSNEKGNTLQLPNNHQQTSDVKKSCEPPKMAEIPKFPDFDESPKSPDSEESPESPDYEESPKSPDEIFLEDHESSNSNTVVEIPTSSPTRSEQHHPSAFELVYKDILEASPAQPWYKQTKGTCKLKKEINSVMLKFFKNPEVINELLNSLVERVLRSDSLNAPFIFIRGLVTTVIRGWDDPIDLSHTPPAPPMAVVHQRCIIILQKLDESNAKIQIEPNVNNCTFSDLYLRESQNIMFQANSTLTLEEMCSLSRAYTAICRSRGSLAKARAFLFDCVYIMPPRSYALVHTIISVWADVLRQVSFPLGLSCVDHTIAYLLLNNCKVKAVQGVSGKVKQTRSFLQNTYEYEKTTKTIDDLVDYLMTRFCETNSSDEASSISWSLFLLARWEGVDFAIQVIEKKLWPFLQRWSSGEYTNNSAAAVINAIGVLGKSVPASKRTDVKKVLDAMKALFQSEGVVPPIQEAAIETVIHLGETEDPKSIFEMVKGWKIDNTNLSQHMRLVLKAFIKRHSNLCVV